MGEVIQPSGVVLKADDDDGLGFLVEFQAQNRQRLLEVEGASVTSSQEDSLRITLRSSRRDFEGSPLYLLDAEMVVGKTIWVGEACVFEGVLTEFGWRTEADVTRELETDPSGEGCYTPKGPLHAENGKAFWGAATPMLRATVTVSPRYPADPGTD